MAMKHFDDIRVSSLGKKFLSYIVCDYRSHTQPSRVYQVFYLLNSSNLKLVVTCKMINILQLFQLQATPKLCQFACILKRNIKIEI